MEYGFSVNGANQGQMVAGQTSGRPGDQAPANNQAMNFQQHPQHQFPQHPGVASFPQQTNAITHNGAAFALLAIEQSRLALQAQWSMQMQQNLSNLPHAQIAAALQRQQFSSQQQPMPRVVDIHHYSDEMLFIREPQADRGSSSFRASFASLSPSYQFTIKAIRPIGFREKLATPQEAHAGIRFTQRADYLLNLLKTNGIKDSYRNHENIVGLQCKYCAGCQTYVKGSASFVYLSRNKVANGVQDAVQTRLKHLLDCPKLPVKVKSFLKQNPGFKNDQDRITLANFSKHWSNAFLATFFPRLLAGGPSVPNQPAAMPGPGRPQTQPGAGRPPGGVSMEREDTRNSSPQHTGPREPVSCDEQLQDAVALASRLVRDGILAFDDIHEMSFLGISALVELFLQNYQLRVTHCFDTNQHGVALCCSNCHDDGQCLSLPALVSQKPLSESLGKDIYDFVVSHTKACPSSSRSVKRMVARHATPFEPDIWKAFCQRCQAHLAKILRCFEKSSSPKQLHCDHYRPLTVSDMKEYGNLPLLAVPNPDIPQPKALKTDRPSIIVVGNELYRDLEGNRWFRREISKHRSLYLELSESQQEMVVDTLLGYVARSGYDFGEVSEGGDCVEVSESRKQEYIRQALKNGFPGLLYPAVAPKAKSKVFDVECAPRVGIFHGDITWDHAIGTDLMHTPVFDKEQVKATIPIWGEKMHPTPNGILEAIEAKYGSPPSRPLSHARITVTPAVASLPEVSHPTAPQNENGLLSVPQVPTERFASSPAQKKQRSVGRNQAAAAAPISPAKKRPPSLAFCNAKALPPKRGRSSDPQGLPRPFNGNKEKSSPKQPFGQIEKKSHAQHRPVTERPSGNSTQRRTVGNSVGNRPRDKHGTVDKLKSYSKYSASQATPLSIKARGPTHSKKVTDIADTPQAAALQAGAPYVENLTEEKLPKVDKSKSASQTAQRRYQGVSEESFQRFARKTQNDPSAVEDPFNSPPTSPCYGSLSESSISAQPEVHAQVDGKRGVGDMLQVPLGEINVDVLNIDEVASDIDANDRNMSHQNTATGTTPPTSRRRSSLSESSESSGELHEALAASPRKKSVGLERVDKAARDNDTAERSTIKMRVGGSSDSPLVLDESTDTESESASLQISKRPASTSGGRVVAPSKRPRLSRDSMVSSSSYSGRGPLADESSEEGGGATPNASVVFDMEPLSSPGNKETAPEVIVLGEDV